MKKPTTKVRTRLLPGVMNDRAKNAIDKLIASGSISQSDLIILCDKQTKRKVAALPIDQQQEYFQAVRTSRFPLLRKQQYLVLAKHFHINLLWLWTGHGSQFINTTNN